MTLAAPNPTGPMQQRVVRATFWAALETAGAQGAAFLFFVVFARLLSPSEFGVYALAMAVVSAVNMILFQGFGDGLIQGDRLDDEATSTAFWTNMALGVAMLLALQVVAAGASAFSAEPMLGPVIAWLSLLCLPRALVSVHSALFRRTLDLRIFAIRTVLGSVAGGLVGVVLALAGYGVWALVVSQFVQSVLIALIMWHSTPWRPRFLFSVPAFHKLFQFSRHFMAASVITSCIDDFGSILVGLTMDITAVGTYSVALRVMRALIILAMTPLQLVMMPALSRVADNRRRFGAAYSEMVLMAATAWLPAASGLGLAAPQLIPAVFGPQWVGAAPVIQAMSFAALTMPLWAFSGQALSALGRPDAFARMAFWQLGLYAVTFPIASRFGVVAVGACWALLSAIMAPVSLRLLGQLSGLDVATLLSRSVRMAVCGAAMAITVLLVEAALPPGLVSLAAAGLAGLAVFAVAAEAWMLPGHLTRLLTLLRSALPIRQEAAQ